MNAAPTAGVVAQAISVNCGLAPSMRPHTKAVMTTETLEYWLVAVAVAVAVPLFDVLAIAPMCATKTFWAA